MSVLIKDMKIPKCCLECPFEDSPEFDSYCIASGNEFIGEWEGLGIYKPDWCPLEEPKTGKWMKVIDEETPNVTKWHYECDQCGAGRFENGQQHCSRCGARMLGEDGEA